MQKHTKPNQPYLTTSYSVHTQMNNLKLLRDQLQTTDDMDTRLFIVDKFVSDHQIKRANWLTGKTYYKLGDKYQPLEAVIQDFETLISDAQVFMHRVELDLQGNAYFVDKLFAAISGGDSLDQKVELLKYATAFYINEIEPFNLRVEVGAIRFKDKRRIKNLFSDVCELLGVTIYQLENIVIAFKHFYEQLEKEHPLIFCLALFYFQHWYGEAGVNLTRNMLDHFQIDFHSEDEQVSFMQCYEELEQACFSQILYSVVTQ